MTDAATQYVDLRSMATDYTGEGRDLPSKKIHH